MPDNELKSYDNENCKGLHELSHQVTIKILTLNVSSILNFPVFVVVVEPDSSEIMPPSDRPYCVHL